MLIQAKIYPHGRNNEIYRTSDGSFEIKVKAKPENGLANQAAIKLLAEYLKVPVERIKLVRGAKSRNKVFGIKNITSR